MLAVARAGSHECRPRTREKDNSTLCPSPIPAKGGFSEESLGVVLPSKGRNALVGGMPLTKRLDELQSRQPPPLSVPLTKRLDELQSRQPPPLSVPALCRR
ncbi:hypothetical protein QE152_g39776 [Popillia japonica]|uniref:Uncharacterized protein n=1 Tax=Popillia japonica TaxID=7064 RepID=A0AAW1HT69_POPJA